MNVCTTVAASRPITRPPLTLLATEPWRAAIEFASHAFQNSRAQPQGDGHPVLIFPGLGASGLSVTPLVKHCRALGYNAFDWGRGRNTGPRGDIDAWLGDLAQHCKQMLEGFEQRATLIGWSLGGLYAREVAKLLQTRVRQVITLGTPFNASADHTNVGFLYKLLNGNAPQIGEALSDRLRTPPAVPTTSIYSRSDGVVAWQTCAHDAARPSDRVEDVHVNGSHLGMAWNPDVLQVVRDRLAQRSGGWRPYVLSATA